MEETQKKERTKVHQAWLYEQQALTHSVRIFIQASFHQMNRLTKFFFNY